MSIDALPPAPAATDPVDTFDAKAFAFNAALQLFRTQANALGDEVQSNADALAAVLLGMALPEYQGTSASSLAIGTGPKTFATQAGKSWVAGQIVVATNGVNLMRGIITSYSGTSLEVNVTSVVGSGTFSSWTIGLSFDGLLLAKSGTNADITSLTALAIIPAIIQRYAQGLRGVDATVASNALTLSASPLSLDFRSTTLGSGNVTQVAGSPVNLVVPAGATLGTVSGVQSDLIVLALNNAGTIELAVVNLAGGTDLSETGVISTTAISAAATAANVVYSAAARTGLAYRVIGMVRSTQATAGQWATAPSLVQGMGGNALSAMQSLGYGQEWEVLSVSSGVTQYNTAGKPISLFINATSNVTISAITVNGYNLTPTAIVTGASTQQSIGGIEIPAWASFSVTYSGSVNFSVLR